MRFRSKLLQPRSASEPALTEIYDVYVTPEGRVEGEDQAMTNALEGALLENLLADGASTSTYEMMSRVRAPLARIGG